MLTAEPISKQAALYTAQAYMLAKGKNINTTQKPFKAPRKAATTNTSADENEAYYYVFNAGNDNGYVIISGDDRTESVLGYVDKGSFDPNNTLEPRASLQPDLPPILRRENWRTEKLSCSRMRSDSYGTGHQLLQIP